MSAAQFQRWFDLTGLQRHLRVLGVFADCTCEITSRLFGRLAAGDRVRAGSVGVNGQRAQQRGRVQRLV